MAAQATTIEGVVNFSNVTQHDVFNGQDTGAYSMTITLSEDDAASLAAQGVKIKDYQALSSVNLSPSLKSNGLTQKATATTVKSHTTQRYA